MGFYKKESVIVIKHYKGTAEHDEPTLRVHIHGSRKS